MVRVVDNRLALILADPSEWGDNLTVEAQILLLLDIRAQAHNLHWKTSDLDLRVRGYVAEYLPNHPKNAPISRTVDAQVVVHEHLQTFVAVIQLEQDDLAQRQNAAKLDSLRDDRSSNRPKPV